MQRTRSCNTCCALHLDQLDAKKGLECTRGDIQQVEHVLQTVVPVEGVNDDNDAQTMRVRVEDLGVSLGVLGVAALVETSCE